jgi:hypothetical protein
LPGTLKFGARILLFLHEYCNVWEVDGPVLVRDLGIQALSSGQFWDRIINLLA